MTQINLLFNSLVSDQVHVHSVRLLADTVDTTSTLDDPDDRPGQVVVHDDVAVLQVLAFREHIGSNKDIDRVGERLGRRLSLAR